MGHDAHHRNIRNAIEMGDMGLARARLQEPLKNPDAETYYLASLVALSEDQRERFLQESLSLDPFYQPAVEALGSLRSTTGELQPDPHEDAPSVLSDVKAPKTGQEPLVADEKPKETRTPSSFRLPGWVWVAAVAIALLVVVWGAVRLLPKQDETIVVGVVSTQAPTARPPMLR